MMPNSAAFPHLDILPPAQQAVWAELGQIPSAFTLYGGTAIALYLGHRESVDFDFFGTHKFRPLDLLGSLPLFNGATVTQSEPSTLSVIVYRHDEPVKLSFFGVPAIKALAAPRICADHELKVASLLDLAGMKAAVVQQRAEPKDYLDMDAILTDGAINLADSLGAARAIYGPSFSVASTLKALTFFGEPALNMLPNAVKKRLGTAVQEVAACDIPELKHWDGAQ
jgi:Nucleotidyl transferase AbiEii toxin, Type IV TA system